MAIWLSQQREVRWNSVNHEKMSVSHSYWRHVKKIHISIVISSFIIIQKEERNEKYMFLWLTFFLSEVSSSKCIHSAYLMPSTKKLTFQKVPLFKRILFVDLKMWKAPTLDLQHLQPAQFGICWQSHEQKREPLDIFEHVLGQVPKIPPPQWYLCYFLLYKYALFYHHCLCLGLIFC